MGRYRWLPSGDRALFDVGIWDDGTLHNPNNYPEAEVRTAVAAADERHRVQRQAGIARGVATRARRRALRIDRIAARMLITTLPSATSCQVCGRRLRDQVSMERAIGPECWDHVLQAVERVRQSQPSQATMP